MSVKVVTVVGARPQFIKASAVSRVFRNDPDRRVREVIVHTGQHFDDNMSAVFFSELEIPPPAHDLGIAGGSHGEMTGRMLERLERVLIDEAPDWVLVYGDTNSTLAGALAAAKLHQPVAHVEAGLRSFNRRMPEEINRIVADRVSTLLFCPTGAAAANLRQEGIVDGVHVCGDVMFDVALFCADRAARQSRIIDALGLQAGAYVLATCHRAESTDQADALAAIVSALAEIARDHSVIFPVHPRTRQALATHGLTGKLAAVRTIDPVTFLDMAMLERNARVIVTDSGGVQKEAFFYGVPCVTLRDETEWVETVAAGRNHLGGRTVDRIRAAFAAAMDQRVQREVPATYGSGDAAERIVNVLIAKSS